MTTKLTVRSTILLSIFIASLGSNSILVADDSPISSTGIVTDNSPAAIAAAKERGTATATKDIKAGTLRVLYFGKPWSVGKPLVDDATGYRVQILAGCDVTATFVAEVEAYNNAVRAFHAKNASATTHK
ncbi:hypothetical protein [Prosthecobacter sp.]|uniref:hypothetical protein n=1 Tax=Prosthecobacter sp. TaxID=1965333 RepID=UPI002AB80741|nr:hypothetical protein [Prosthecobacter sp.]MDZ4405869.1 hypothetical protein [Prosthecobacter sp.]